MAKLMLQPYNLLALDEPTNHMDIKSKDILKQALKAYDGTLLVVSHDRDFLDGLVDKMYEFRDGKVREHLGSVTEFLQKRKMETLQELERRFRKGESAQPADPVKSTARQEFQVRKTESKEARKLRSRIAFLEDEIAKREKEMAAIEKILSAPTEKDDVMELTRDYLEKKRDLDARTAEWEKLMEETL
jgi:ATP-binding cassette subfamily F protein 3